MSLLTIQRSEALVRGAARARRPLLVPQLDMDAATQAAIDAVDDVVARQVSGELASIVRSHLQGGGKRVRVRMALECAQAIGVPLRAAVPLAAASELLHNATLIHDDLQDGDRVRRGRPTVWAEHGMAQAINAGDVLLMLPFVALAESPEATARGGMMAMVARRAAATACGQADELAMLGRAHLDWAHYEAAARGKTGQIFAMPFEGATLLTGASRDQGQQVGDLATALGVAYQVADDVLDLLGDKGRGAVGNDLREGKVSAVVAAHLELLPDDRQALLALLRKPRDKTTDAEVRAWTDRFLVSGSFDAAIGHARAACASFETASVTDAARRLRPLLSAMRERFLDPAERALEAAR